MNIISFFQIILFLNFFESILSLRFPINKNLDNSTGEISLIEIETRKSYINYTKSNKTISLFYSNYCKYCNYLLDIFKWGSTYTNVSDWNFLWINCTKRQLLCSNFNISRFPTIKTYINKKELAYEPPLELFPLLEYLIKLSTPSLIEINNSNISQFYSSYDYFSPIVEYISENNAFYNCIKNLSETKFKTHFYFGMKKISQLNNTITEKIIIDNNGAPFVHMWDNNCTNIKIFLDEHIFPLITFVNDATFFYELNKSRKLLIMLFGFLSNNQTKSFVDNEYKHLSYEKNKKYIFSFLNYTSTKKLNHYFSVKLYGKSELKLIIYDFNKSKYYNEPNIYDLNYNNPKEIIAEFNYTLNNLTNITFTTGNFFKDFLEKYGINEITKKLCLIFVLIILFCTILLSVCCTFFCKKFCPAEIDEKEYFDNNLINNNDNKKLKND